MESARLKFGASRRYLFVSPSLRWFLLVAGLPLSVFLGLLAAFNVEFFLHACEHQTDYELISLNVENAKHFEALTGAYSRFQFRHPGPVAFYWYAAIGELLWFLPRPLGRSALAQFFLSSVFILSFAYCLFRLFRPRVLALIGGLFLIMLCAGSSGTSLTVLSDVWNPFVAITPMAVVAAAGALVARGSLAFCFPLTCAAVVVAHTHLGALPVAGILWVLSVGLGVISRLRGSRALSAFEKGALAATLFIGLTTSAPIMYEALSRPGGGNLGTIWRFVDDGKDTQSLGVVLSAISAQYGKLLRPIFSIAGLAVPGATVLGVLLLLLFLPGTSVVRQRRVTVIALSAVAVSLWSLSRTQGELYFYLLLYHFGVAAFVWSAALAAVVAFVRPAGNLLGRRFPASLFVREWRGGHARRVSGVVLGAVLVYGTAMVLMQLTRHPPVLKRCSAHGEARYFVRFLNPQRGVVYHLRMRDPNLWHSLARLALVMRRSGYHICVDREWWYLFDSSLVCDRPSIDKIVTLHDLEKGALPEGVPSTELRGIGITVQESVPAPQANTPSVLSQ